ncbi:MAG: guanylate kinase [Gemmatimonadetes bacterium]|nr:guanylate kinase [Gemmatimonadota bacterium]
MTPFPIILSSPSGGGKTTIARMLVERRPDVGYSVSCTTRSPRAGEVQGRDYHFLTLADFGGRVDRGEFAEHAHVHGNRYGTLKGEVDRVFASGRHVIMDIDVQGARQFMASYPESVLVFLLPPSADVLVGRLTGRKTEDAATTLKRLQGARDELAEVGHYQYVVVNDDLETAYRQVASIVEAEAVRHARLPRTAERVRHIVGALNDLIQQFPGN